MPLFLVHGFRWTRKSIRIFIILNNLSDASADNLMSPSTPPLLLQTLNSKYPTLLRHLPDLTFIEQYNPDDLHTGAQPHAFVADKVIRADLAVDVTECMGQTLGVKAWDAMADLRDELAGEEKVGWYAVWNGDTERQDIGDVEVGGDVQANASRRHGSGSGSSATSGSLIKSKKSSSDISGGGRGSGSTGNGRGRGNLRKWLNGKGVKG